MSDTPAFREGRSAFEVGMSAKANPHEKPARPPSGEDYPGPWACWLEGWCFAASLAGYECPDARRELCDHIGAGL